MKKVLFVFVLLGLLSSCSKVPPNYTGVLMENYGKNGKKDFSIQFGRVFTASPGTELFLVPGWTQRANFVTDKNADGLLHLQSSDNGEFTAKPSYSWKAKASSAIDLVFNNSRLDAGDNFAAALENNVIEPLIYDVLKERSQQFSTDSLMATGGKLNFEKYVYNIIFNKLDSIGVFLETYSTNLLGAEKVRQKIEVRNEISTNVTVIDEKIIEQKKQNEFLRLQAEGDKIKSSGITPALLQQQFIEKWDGKTTLYYGQPPSFMKNIQ